MNKLPKARTEGVITEKVNDELVQVMALEVAHQQGPASAILGTPGRAGPRYPSGDLGLPLERAPNPLAEALGRVVGTHLRYTAKKSRSSGDR